LEEAKHGLRLLAEAGTRKVNFAGGEPLLPKHRTFLGELIRYLKEELKLDCVSIVSNGSQLNDKWFETYGPFIDFLAISCDSANEETNQKIGRASGKAKQVENLRKAKAICERHSIRFKINSVVNRYNWDEDMNWLIQELKPERWKVFQVLGLEGENIGKTAKRDVERFLISDEEFEAFCKRHQSQSCLVPESNKAMKDSYLLLDEKMRFLNCSYGSKLPTKSILDVGVSEALKEAGFDEDMFYSRGGVYDWNRSLPSSAINNSQCASSNSIVDIEDF